MKDEILSVEDINKELDDFFDDMEVIDKRLKIPTKIKDEEEIDSLLELIKSPDSINLISDIDKNYYGD